MGIFGPYYPPLLQLAMSHAERFAALLSRIESGHRPQGEAARAWVVGRTEEIETVVGCVVEDWLAGRLTEEGAERAVSAYLRAMHAGAEARLGLGPVPECCLGDVAETVSGEAGAKETGTGTLVLPASAPPDGDTLVDPAAVLADMVGKHSRWPGWGAG